MTLIQIKSPYADVTDTVAEEIGTQALLSALFINANEPSCVLGR